MMNNKYVVSTGVQTILRGVHSGVQPPGGRTEGSLQY